MQYIHLYSLAKILGANSLDIPLADVGLQYLFYSHVDNIYLPFLAHLADLSCCSTCLSLEKWQVLVLLPKNAALWPLF